MLRFVTAIRCSLVAFATVVAVGIDMIQRTPGVSAAVPGAEWVSHEGAYFWADNDSGRMNYAAAESHCVEVGKAAGFDGHLASFHSSSEYNAVHGTLPLKDTGGVFDGSANWYWIGLNDVGVETLWEHTDGTPVDFTYWAAGEPGLGFKDCAAIGKRHLFSGDRWITTICASAQYPLCKFTSETPPDWALVDGSYYWRSHGERLGFYGAENHCVKVGKDSGMEGHLASFHSSVEYNAVMAALPTSSGIGNQASYWIGMSDQGLEGTYTYTDGTMADWFYFAPGEPSPGQEEDCVGLERQDANAMDMWYDYPCSVGLFPLCKFKPSGPPNQWSRVGDSSFFWASHGARMAWQDAEAHCEATGRSAGFTGHLASFHSAEEYANVLGSLPLRDTGVGPESNWYWMGLNDLVVEGVWGYTDRSPLSWVHWGPGQPDNLRNQQHCAAMGKNHQTVLDKWVDMPCSAQFFPLCRFQT